MNSSNELVSIYAISFVVSSCLVPLIGTQTSDVTDLKISHFIQTPPKFMHRLELGYTHTHAFSGVNCKKMIMDQRFKANYHV